MTLGPRSPSATPDPSDNIVGNVYDKYGTRNPIAQWLMRGFLDAVTELYRQSRPATVLEVGCGEGWLAARLWTAHRPQRFVACDLSLDHIAPSLDPAVELREASIYNLPFDNGSFDMVVCCEVLEHLQDPGLGLAELARVARAHVLLSTPWDPVWRALNMARGRYLSRLGNTPGHVQHFTRRGLERLAQTHLRLLARRTPLPWTVLLGEPLR